MEDGERSQVNVRVAAELKKQIQKLVDADEYQDVSHFVTEAIKEKLDPEHGMARFIKMLREGIKDPGILRDIERSLRQKP